MSMIRKSGSGFPTKIMLKQESPQNQLNQATRRKLRRWL
jgi:hypothetical protein